MEGRKKEVDEVKKRWGWEGYGKTGVRRMELGRARLRRG